MRCAGSSIRAWRVIITSDKCYDNVEWPWGYRETDALGGRDVYSGSKGGAELVFRSFWYSFFKAEHPVRMATTRAGNVIGGGDWAADRIVADCVRAWKEGRRVQIRSPAATRPWQHVLEPLSGYLTLAQAMRTDPTLSGESFNFGPRAEQNARVVDLLGDLGRVWGLNESESYDVTGNIPFHEAGLLKLNCDKALLRLRWQPTLSYDECVSMTGGWYRDVVRDGSDAGEATHTDIATYVRLADREAAGLGLSERVLLTRLRRIQTPRGAVLHGMKAVDPGYAGFGEAYFSMVDRGAVKGWKRHQRMVLNLVVCVGAIRFYVRDEDGWAGSVVLSPEADDSHARLTVPAGMWMAFEGVGEAANMVLNVASIGHDPSEAETAPIERFELLRGETIA